MLKNIWNRIISVASVLVMIAYISLPQIHIIYATYQDNEENTIYLDNPNKLTDTKKDVSIFEYDCQDFSAKAEINADTIFSIEDIPLTADDVQLVVSVIDKTNEQYQLLQEKFADDTHRLLLYNMNFYTKDGTKVNVSNCDADIKLSFKEPYISCNSEEINVIHIDDTSLDSTNTEIIGISFINNQLTDVSFHVSSFSMYGILFPNIEQDTQTEYDNSKNYRNFPSLFTIGDSSSSNTTVNTIEKFSLSLDNGYTRIDTDDNGNKKYVWVADTSNEGHGFIYKITFSVSGSDLPPNSVEITIPKQILKNSDGNFAGDIILPYPSENEEYDTNIVNYVYREDGDNIIIYNIHNVQAGTLEIPFMYETTEKTWEYIDMQASNDCVANVTITTKDTNGNETTISAETDKIPVYIDTGVKIDFTKKMFKYIYNTWQSSWGLDEPENSSEYIYIIWQINSSIIDITQKYNFNLNDTPIDHGGEVIGYRMQGSNKYVFPSPTIENLTASSRTDYVLVKYPKSYFPDTDTTYTINNSVDATVIPIDDTNAFTTDTDTATYQYENKAPIPPEYTSPMENYTISKYGIYGSKKHITNQNQISSYSLEDLTNGKNLSGLMYHIQANAYAYIHTLADGHTGTELDAETEGIFGQKSVIYAISDSQIFLNDSEDALTKDDYTFTSLEYNVKMQSATYNRETKSFDKNNVTTFADSDILTFYVMTEDNEEYIPIATYKLNDDTINYINNNYVSSLTSSKISFKGNIKGWKIETSNPYYCTMFDIYPTITLKSTENVTDAIGENSKLSVRNNSVLNTFDTNRKQISTRSATGTDYIATVTRDSKINKNFVSAKNYPGQRCYKIDWKTSISETYTDDSGTFPVKQELGVFYDLIPIGSRIDINSIKVYADGVELLEGEYIIDTTPNYKNSNRTLITVRINSSTEEVYTMTYTTVHLWEDVLDYGRYVLNSVAYETGNEDIAKGYPDNGGNISDSTILDNLDPNSNAKRFLYSQSTHYINALIPHSSGITKKVASSDDAVFSDSTIVHQNSTYTYNIRMENSSLTQSKDIIIFDSLENFQSVNDVKLNGVPDNKSCDWHGTLESFGLSNLENKGIEPVIYLSSVENLNLEDYRQTQSNHDFFSDTDNKGNPIWIEYSQFEDISKAKAFAIDLRHKTNGEPFILDANESFSFTITMRSPKTVDSNDISLETYNNIYRSFISVDAQTQAETYYYTHYDYTTVTYRIVGTLHFKKINSDTQECIQGIKFNLSGTSDYGTEIDKDIVTNANGEIYVTNLERGSYTLKETYSTADYLPCEDKIVTVDANGNVTITSNDGTTTDGILLIENEPRIHGDLKFLKRDALNLNIPLIGAEFQLTGTSDYGNVIKKISTSNGYGVTIEDIELGTYKLVEITPPIGSYIKPKIEYTVVCNSDGILSIKELSMNENGDYIVTNMKTQSFIIHKIDEVGGEPLQYAEYTLTSTNTIYGYPITKTLTTNMYGDIEFTGLDFGTYTLQETKAPPNHILDKTVYTVEIVLDGNNNTVVTIKDAEGNPIELQTNSTTGENFFEFENERSYTGTIRIIKNWVDDVEDNAERPTPVIHLSTEEPQVEIHTATIDISTLKTSLGTDATSFQRNDTYSLEQVEALGGVKIGKAVTSEDTDGNIVYDNPDKQEDVYLFKETKDVTAEDGTTKTEVNYYYWSKAKNIYLGESGASSAQELFRFKNNITTIDLSGLNTSKVTNMQQMFYECKALKSLDLSNFDTSNVTNMRSMFMTCPKLEYLDLSSFNTSKVTTMYQMFNGCSELKSLKNLSSLDTSNVNTMFKMFSGCSQLTSLDLSHFDTSKVTSMSYMFYGCKNLTSTSLNISSFNTSKVTDMSYMFFNCSGLTSLDLSKFNTNNVTNMRSMFYGCKNLTSLDLSSFNTVKVTNMRSMFEGCSGLTSLDLSNFNTSNVGSNDVINSSTNKYENSMYQMFLGCSSLTSLDLSSFDTSKVKTMFKMFYECGNLTSLNLSNFDTSNVTDMEQMFSKCYNLSSLDLSDFDTSKIKNMYNMFFNCSSLTSLDLSSFNTSNVTNMSQMFHTCSSLKTIYASDDLWSTSSVENSSNMFEKCTVLVGGNSTKYIDAQVKDHTYAHIDTEDNPGYFTDIKDKPTTTSTALTTPTTETQVTAFFNSVSNTVRAYKAVANASLMVLQTLLYANETTTPTTTDTTPTNESENENDSNNNNNSSNITEYISTDTTKATWTKEGDTWVCEFKVYNDEAEYFVWEEPISGYKCDATAENPLIMPQLKTGNIYIQSVPHENNFDLKLFKAVTEDGVEVEDSSAEFMFDIILTKTDENDTSLSGYFQNGIICNITKTLPTDQETPTEPTEPTEPVPQPTITFSPDGKGNLIATVILKNKEELTVLNIPNGINYQAVEVRTQTITNTNKEVGSLKLSKKVTQNGTEIEDDSANFTFEIILSKTETTSTDIEDNYFESEHTFSNVKFSPDENNKLKATVTLKNKETLTINNIPVGISYEIKEMNIPNYYKSKTTVPVSGNIEKNTTKTVIWENEYNPPEVGEFYVSKTVELYQKIEKADGTITEPTSIALTDEEKNKEFTFTATLTGLKVNSEYSVLITGGTSPTFKSNGNGNATVTFTLKDGQKANFTGIPIGATYQITETTTDEYMTSYELKNEGTSSDVNDTIASQTGTFKTETETLDSIYEKINVTFTNSKIVTIQEEEKLIEVSVEKKWVDDKETDRPKSITVYLNRGAKISSNSDTLTNNETCNTVTITANNEWKTVFTDLPQKDEQGREYVYSVKEEPIAGYNSKISSTTDENGNYFFTVINTKIPTYDLSISKTVNGVLGNKAKQFEFTITLKDSNGNPLNGFYTLQRGNDEITTLFDVNGTAKIGISHGETIVIKNLPQSTEFIIVETDYSKDGYTTQSGLDDIFNNSSIVTDVLDKDKTIKYINTCDGILPTGINSNAIPLIILGILSVSIIILLKRKISH